ncbi:GNAT family protein [Streptosporangium sp. NPDC051022]|uniref:GNAT family N-acetyltransferase n=1 Tax=Streptosporangium sp. NPDC051022 TaxID=3155752 RepID=UPI00344137B4
MIRLRAFEPEDATVVASWVSDVEALTMWSGHAGFSWPFDARQLVAFYADPGRRPLVVAEADGTPVGHLSLKPDVQGWSARLGLVMVSPERRGRGYGAAMIRDALAVAFGDLRVHRVDLGVYTQNAGAIALYERLGFRREGVQREVTRVNGRWWSVLTMGMLDHEWRTPATSESDGRSQTPHRPS